MNYRQYTAEDLLMDESFIRHCRQEDPESTKHWQNWISANPEQTSEYTRAIEMYRLLTADVASADIETDRRQLLQMLDDLEPGMPVQHHVNPARRRKMIFAAAAVAATLVIVAGVSIFINDFESSLNRTTYSQLQQTKPGERKSFQLPDGTQVILNAGSELNLAADFNKSKREITLSGEAYFHVKHDKSKPFIIHTSQLDVKVLGTVFNVRAYEDDAVAETSLISGSVEVTVKGDNNRTVILKPNEKIVIGQKAAPGTSSGKTATVESPYSIARLQPTDIDSSIKEVSWVNNRLVFGNERLEDIAKNLERWYDVRIEFGSDVPKDYRYTASFDKETIREVLDALTLSRSFSFTIKEGDKLIQIDK